MVNYNIVTRNDIIDRAAKLVNAMGVGESMPPDVIADFSRALNAMVRHWQMQGIHLWAVGEATLFPQPGQYQYTVGTGATDHVTDTYFQTEVTANATLAATGITVADTSGVTIGNQLGITLDDGSVHWTTVSAKTATTLTFPAALPDSTAAGHKVWTYATKIAQPIKIVGARRFDLVSEVEIPINLEARLTYRGLPTKRDSGVTTSMFYDRHRVTGTLNLWRVPGATTSLVKFTYHKPLGVFAAATDEADFPLEWEQALAYNLALNQMPLYPVKPDNRALITGLATQFLDDMKGADRENESVFFGVDMGV